jgi:O-antigen/teichoic acid export membrane protein
MFGGERFALVRSSGWAMAEYLAYPVMMLAAMPLYLWALGTAQYGQWMLLLTVTGFGGLAGLGMGPTATRMVAAAAGRGEMENALDAARACLAITLASALALAAIILLAGWTVGDEMFARVGTRNDILTIVGFAAFLLTIEQIDSVFAGILRGLERFDLSARLEIGAKIVQVVCTAVVVWHTRSLIAVFLVMSLIAIARTGAKVIVVQRQLSVDWLTPKWVTSEVRVAFQFGKWVWLQSAGSLMFAVADRALIGAMLGANALAQYAIALQLVQQVQTVPAAGAQVLFPAVAKRQQAGQDWRALATRATLAVAMFGTIGALALVLLGNWFLQLWVGPTLAAEVSPVLPWLALAFGLLSFPTVAHHVLMGSGRAVFVAISTIIAGLLCLLLAPWTIGQMGLTGAAAGRIGYAMITLIMIPAMYRPLKYDEMRGPDL